MREISVNHFIAYKCHKVRFFYFNIAYPCFPHRNKKKDQLGYLFPIGALHYSSSFLHSISVPSRKTTTNAPSSHTLMWSRVFSIKSVSISAIFSELLNPSCFQKKYSNSKPLYMPFSAFSHPQSAIDLVYLWNTIYYQPWFSFGLKNICPLLYSNICSHQSCIHSVSSLCIVQKVGANFFNFTIIAQLTTHLTTHL